MNNKIGGIIYAHRRVKGITQEELGSILSISGTAVSKWERGVSYPDVELLCKIANFFEISTDELLGRNLEKIEEIRNYSVYEIETLEIAKQLMECYKLSCQEGLLAVEEVAEKGKLNVFLSFVIKKCFELNRKEMSWDCIKSLLNNYCRQEKNRNNAEMITEVVLTMFSGVSENTMLELISSHLGRRYGDTLMLYVNKKDLNREEIISSYNDKEARIGLIEELISYSDEIIKMIIRNVDNTTLSCALIGASGRVCIKFMNNISDKLLEFIDVDIKNCNVDDKTIINAQKEILRLVGELIVY